MGTEKPIVSVCMNTFQHEHFIARAIEGVLMQETDFPVELVIGEDLSADSTLAICESYARKYGDRIRLLPSDKKYGQNVNMFRTLKACSGKYIAMCEGDDFWTDPGKLQKQVDFLEANPEYVLCFHPIHAVDQEGNLEEVHSPKGMISLYQGLSLFHTFVPTPAMVFRNCLEDYPHEFFKVKSTDAFLCAMLSGFGLAADLDFVGACYRRHAGGFYNRLSLLGRYKQSIYARKMMRRSSYFNPEQKREIRRELQRREVMYLKSFLKKGEVLNFLRMAFFYLSVR